MTGLLRLRSFSVMALQTLRLAAAAARLPMTTSGRAPNRLARLWIWLLIHSQESSTSLVKLAAVFGLLDLSQTARLIAPSGPPIRHMAAAVQPSSTAE